MKNLTICGILLIVMAFSPTKERNEIKGSWQVVKAQYGSEPMQEITDTMIIKSLTGTRWSAVYYKKETGAFDGAGGGTYQIKGDQYVETVEYFSWDPPVIGKTFVFTLTIENGMLHQKGLIEYKGNKNYIIDEWYKRID